MIAAVNNDSHMIVPAGNRLTVRIAAEVVHKERTLDARDEVSSKETNALNQDISAKPHVISLRASCVHVLRHCTSAHDDGHASKEQLAYINYDFVIPDDHRTQQWHM